MDRPRDNATIKVNFLGEIRTALKRRDVELALNDGSSIADLLGELSLQFGERFKRQIFDGNGMLLSHVSIFVNGNDIKSLEGVGTRLSGGEVDVLILPTYGGG